MSDAGFSGLDRKIDKLEKENAELKKANKAELDVRNIISDQLELAKKANQELVQALREAAVAIESRTTTGKSDLADAYRAIADKWEMK